MTLLKSELKNQNMMIKYLYHYHKSLITKVTQIGLIFYVLFKANLGLAGFDYVTVYPTSMSDIHRFELPYTGHFKAINGNSFDVSEYYQPANTEFNISGVILLFLDNGTTIRIDGHFDNGFRSALYEVDQSLSFGLNITKTFENKHLNLGISNLLLFGASVKERACVDDLQRDFHCGTGLPWSDYKGFEIQLQPKAILKWSVYF